MIILGIDTTTAVCEVSLALGNGTYTYQAINEGLVHSERLVPLIDELLNAHNHTVHSLHGIAVNIGPGSFTGIRVGVTVARALAQGLQLRVAPIVGLDALAYTCVEWVQQDALHDMPENMVVCPMIDALRGEVYAALYDYDHARTCVCRRTEYAIADQKTIATWIEDAKKKHATIACIGSGIQTMHAVLEVNKQDVACVFPPENSYCGDMIARRGAYMFEHNTALQFEKVVPLYIRKSEAEAKRMQNA